jgi:toxin YoeB
MVRKIIWSLTAKRYRLEILQYWISRNKSTFYSKKLNTLFKEAIKLIALNIGIGHLTEKENVKVKTIRDYLILYEIKEDEIHILAIFDGRRNSEMITKKIEKK